MNTTDKVTEVLTSEPQTVAQIAEAAEASKDSVRKALKDMVEAGTAELIEGEAPNDPHTFRTPKRTRANHGYSRNTKDGERNADVRDWAVLAFIDENGPSTKAELAEGLGLTKRTVSHAVWRLMGKPNKGSTSAPVILEQVTRGTYARVEDEAEVEAEAS